MSSVTKRVSALFDDDYMEDFENNILLKTIKIPKNLMYLTDRLPKPSY